MQHISSRQQRPEVTDGVRVVTSERPERNSDRQRTKSAERPQYRERHHTARELTTNTRETRNWTVNLRYNANPTVRGMTADCIHEILPEALFPDCQVAKRILESTSQGQQTGGQASSNTPRQQARIPSQYLHPHTSPYFRPASLPYSHLLHRPTSAPPHYLQSAPPHYPTSAFTVSPGDSTLWTLTAELTPE